MKDDLCKKCRVPLSEETAHPSTLKKGSGRCIACHKLAMKAQYDADPGKWRAQANARRRNSPEIYRAYDMSFAGRHNNLRKRMTKDGSDPRDLLWNIRFYSALIDGAKCHYCDGSLNLTGCALDCIDNELGHVSYNVVPCCKGCNTKKFHDTTYEEMMLLAPALREVRRRREAVNALGAPMCCL